MAYFKFATLLIVTLASTLLLVSNCQIEVDKGRHTPKRPPIGTWKKIKDLNDPKIIAVAEFAVEEANKVSNDTSPLTFKRIMSGRYQIVAGTLYHLIIEAQRPEEEIPKPYATSVFVGLDKTKKLIYFHSFDNE
uniref:Cystatin domain-containing protein n=1 Tax=Kalanchoe fedtschenkoi TaxID=63787 RepID=A0A7N0TQS2_KALFE